MKYTPELVNDLLQDLERGATVKSACERQGITESAFYSWNQEGHESFKIEFFEAVKKARDIGRKHKLDLLIDKAHTRALGETVKETKKRTYFDRDGKEVTETTITEKDVNSDTVLMFLITNDSNGEYVNSHNRQENKGSEKIEVIIDPGFLPDRKPSDNQ